MKRWPLFVAVLIASAVSASEVYGQRSQVATGEAAFEATESATAPLLRVTGLSSALMPSAPAPEGASVRQSADATEQSAGSRAQFKLWCLGLFLGGAAVYWAGDQADIEFVANAGAFVAVVGLLGVIMPTW